MFSSTPPKQRQRSPLTPPSSSASKDGHSRASTTPTPAFNFTGFTLSDDNKSFNFEFAPPANLPPANPWRGSSPQTPATRTGSSRPARFDHGTPEASKPVPFTFGANVRPLSPPKSSPLSSPHTAAIPTWPSIANGEASSTANDANGLTTTLGQLSLSPKSRDSDCLAASCLSPALPVASTQVRRPSTPAQGSRSQAPSSPVTPDPGVANRPSKAAPAPYDVRDEQDPSHPFFTAAFQTALKKGVDTAQKAVTLIQELESRGKSDEALARLLRDAMDLASFSGSETRTIAVLGDSGEGKSSLINSLLHYPDVAKTGDIGSACTSVVTEYRQKTSKHTAHITIEVEYLSGSGIEDMIHELLWNYRKLFLPDVDSDKTPAADYARYMRESEQAWSALEAAFKHRPEFTKEMLQDMSEGSLERIQDRLVEWTRDIQWPSGVDSAPEGTWQSTAETAEECAEKTSVFMQDRYWPFTKIIRIYLDAQVLKTGLVLADLPGLQDTNLARVRATQDYLVKCNNIFIVAKISRAITDQSLKSSLYSVLAKHVPLAWEEAGGKGLNIAVICTKSEDINLRTARTEFCGPGKVIDAAAMSKLDDEIEAARTAGDRDRKKDLKTKQKLLLMKARSDHVKEGLRRVYSSKVPGENLDVFCVSNTMYEKYTRKGKRELVKASEIPDLRRFCSSITAEARYREALHFLQSSIPSLLHSLSLWVNSHSVVHGGVEDGSDEDCSNEDLYDTLLDALQLTEDEITSAVPKFSEDFNLCLSEQVLRYFEERELAWEQAAAAEGRQWMTWHWTQYNAFCLNNGHHETPKITRMDWNAKIIWKMRMELAFQWDLVEEEASDAFERLRETVITQLEDLKDTVEDTTGSSTASFGRPLAEGIDYWIKDIEYNLSCHKREFISKVKAIRRCASETNYNSYVLNEMLPAYRSASSQRGTGMSARQKNIVQGRITDGTLFPNISVSISTAMAALMEETERQLRADTTAVLSHIENDFGLALQNQSETLEGDGSEGDEDEGEADERVTELVDEVEQLRHGHARLLETIPST